MLDLLPCCRLLPAVSRGNTLRGVAGRGESAGWPVRRALQQQQRCSWEMQTPAQCLQLDSPASRTATAARAATAGHGARREGSGGSSGRSERWERDAGSGRWQPAGVHVNEEANSNLLSSSQLSSSQLSSRVLSSRVLSSRQLSSRQLIPRAKAQPRPPLCPDPIKQPVQHNGTDRQR